MPAKYTALANQQNSSTQKVILNEYYEWWWRDASLIKALIYRHILAILVLNLQVSLRFAIISCFIYCINNTIVFIYCINNTNYSIAAP